MKEEVFKIIEQVEDKDIKNVVSNIINDNLEDFLEMPAACSHHHAWKGGLAVHSVNTARNAIRMCDDYKDYVMARHGVTIDKDVAVVGSLLHDIGKINCYHFGKKDPTSITSTIESRWFHHIPMGFHIVASEIEKTPGNLTRKRINNLLHVIISHHGKVEWSSPRPPKTIEAFIAHQADYLDAWLDNWAKKKSKV